MTLSITEILLYAAALLATGVAAGFVAGLLGVGGGIVIVPVLYLLFSALGVPEEVRMHVAVGTSLSTIVFTSFSSLRAHNSRGAVDWELFRSWAPGIVIGVLLGTALASVISGKSLTAFFGGVALIVAGWMAFSSPKFQPFSGLPQGILKYIVTGCIGIVSALMGIGGGTLSVPTMTLCGYPIHKAVGTASAVGFLIGVPGTIGMIIGGWNHTTLTAPPFSLGYVSLLGLVLILPTSMLLAPYGAKAAHALPVRGLKIAFAIFLAVTSIKMLSSLWTG
jgi:uncharacterized membrane protein YfcA